MLLSLLSRRKLDADSRDAYGFTVRPQHLQRYKEYSSIYKEEESERSDKWAKFFDRQAQPAQAFPPEEYNSSLCGEEKERNNEEESKDRLKPEVPEQQAEHCRSSEGRGDSSAEKSTSDLQAEKDSEKEVGLVRKESRKVQIWTQLRPLLHDIENMMSHRVKKRKSIGGPSTTENHLRPLKEARTSKIESEEDSGEMVYDKEMSEGTKETPAEESCSDDGVDLNTLFPWKQELEFLVHGGIPRDLRGEAWQAFVGVRTRRVELYYQSLLAPEGDVNDSLEQDTSGNCTKDPNGDIPGVPRKWTRQIEKDLPRTFPGHPALDETGRSSLRRILLAYAKHNPSVGYCQAMNFFAGILLLMMPEENAFWTLVGIIDDYFDGYYSEEMIESQVDQLVFEELMRERFPKLVNHLDYLGVQVAWLSGPWFLSIFVNMLPWESVLRIWDVLLYEGNRVMLFRTALALMELYGPALVTTKDAGDAITLLQSLTGSTFDSSQLVLTACMGFLSVTEDRLEELREKHRPAVLEAAAERSRGKVSKESKSLATKLYSFKHDRGTPKKQTNGEDDKQCAADILSDSTNLDNFLNGLTMDSEAGSVPDLQEQVSWLKAELCKMMEEKRSATLRAEELETALMEMVKEDNRRQLSAKAEQLEQEVIELRQVLSDKKEQENAMLQVLMRVEQEQRVAEDARIFAEQDAAAQKYAVQMLQEKLEKATSDLSQMEKRAVMAETMLEATVQYEKGQVKAVSSPRSMRPESPSALPAKKMGLLSFGLGWKNKGKPTDESKPSEGMSPTVKSAETNNSDQFTEK